MYYRFRFPDDNQSALRNRFKRPNTTLFVQKLLSGRISHNYKNKEHPHKMLSNILF